MPPEIDKDIISAYNSLIRYARFIRKVAGRTSAFLPEKVEQSMKAYKKMETDFTGSAADLFNLLQQTHAKDAPVFSTVPSGKRFEYIPYPEEGSYIHVITVGDTALGVNKETNHLQFLSGTKEELLEADKSLIIHVPVRKSPLI